MSRIRPAVLSCKSDPPVPQTFCTTMFSFIILISWALAFATAQSTTDGTPSPLTPPDYATGSSITATSAGPLVTRVVVRPSSLPPPPSLFPFPLVLNLTDNDIRTSTSAAPASRSPPQPSPRTHKTSSTSTSGRGTTPSPSPPTPRPACRSPAAWATRRYSPGSWLWRAPARARICSV